MELPALDIFANGRWQALAQNQATETRMTATARRREGGRREMQMTRNGEERKGTPTRREDGQRQGKERDDRVYRNRQGEG
uniref:Uncharacterized protein n=1 Tax=Cucumis melo TaxID=3656 RepID=A0A9I9D190_CUCME